MRYRPEIDGLRAFAVVPVILFHSGLELFSGGYVGVDIFFVISGYLISTIIMSQLDDGRFSLIEFYERRARRILPALFLVVTVSMAVAAAVMTPRDLEAFAQSVLGVATFSSNIVFWTQSGYFDTAAELKPLLHTWSLAVEEQFYILFPLFLMACWKLGRKLLVTVLIVVFIVSLGLAQWAAYAKPDAAFFLLPTRAWELLIGIFAAVYVGGRERRNDAAKPSSLVQWAGIAGLAMIGFSAVAFGSETPFPSLYTLVPTVGTALLILFARPGTYAQTLLSHRLFVGIGLLSYSAYLWHFPLFAFARYIGLSEPPRLTMLGLSVLTMGLAYLSWRFVEKPFRSKSGFGRRVIFSASAGSIVAISGAAIALISTQGLIARYGPQERRVFQDQQANSKMMEKAYDRYGCFFDYSQSASGMLQKGCLERGPGRNLFLFGDSEAAHYREGLLPLAAAAGLSLRQFTGTSCRPIYHRGMTGRCRAFVDAFLANIGSQARPGDVIVVSGNWSLTEQRIGERAFAAEVRSLLQRLARTGARILLVGNTPSFSTDPYSVSVRFGLAGKSSVSLPVEDYHPSEHILRGLSASMRVGFFSPVENLCRGRLCLFKEKDRYLFFDSDHLSFDGSRRLSARMRALL